MKRNEYVRCLYPSLHIQSTSVFCDNYANTRAAVDAALRLLALASNLTSM